jgi:hypothetical protein
VRKVSSSVGNRKLRFTTLDEGTSKKRKVVGGVGGGGDGDGDEDGNERTHWDYSLKSDPGTPNISET